MQTAIAKAHETVRHIQWFQVIDTRGHRIDGAEKLIALDASTKMNAEWEFLLYLKAIGREAAESFLEQHFDSIGVRSTLDVGEELRKG